MKCCICGKEINSIHEQNNPWPIYDYTKACCSDCNYKYIIPARLGCNVKLPNKKEN